VTTTRASTGGSAATLTCVLVLASCAGTETGNPSFDGTLSYNAYSTNPQQVALLAGDPDEIVVDTAWLVLGDVGFVPSDMCDPEAPTELHAPGLGVGDHAPAGAPETPLTLAAGSYCGMHLPFVRAVTAPSNAPADLVNHSALIEGTLADGRAFRITSAFEGDLFLAATDADFEMSAAEPRALVAFDVATWLGALNWAGATADSNGVVLVDDANNSALLQTFEQNLARGTALYRDPDGAGQVTSSSVKLADGTP